MENIIIKLVKEPYGRDKDIQNLFCYIAGECDSKEEHTRYCCGEGVPLAPGKADSEETGGERGTEAPAHPREGDALTGEEHGEPEEGHHAALPGDTGPEKSAGEWLPPVQCGIRFREPREAPEGDRLLPGEPVRQDGGREPAPGHVPGGL